MYQVQFFATSSAYWAQAIELIDADTNQPLEDIDSASFALEVDDECGARLLSASTEDGTLTRPFPYVVQWNFTPEQHSSLCPGSTYRVGLTMTTATGTIQLLIGTLAYLDGIVS